MRIRKVMFSVLSLSTVLAALQGCGDSGSCDLVPNVAAMACNPASGGFTLDIDNEFWPMEAGQVWVLEGTEAGMAVRLVITVLNETEVVAGVTTRVVEERQTEGGELVEVSRNFFVQAANGTLCYFGEDVDNYENGVVANHDGQWRSGVSGANPGVFMPAGPTAGMIFQQEEAPGIAEDTAEILALDESVQVPAGTFTDTLRTNECNPLEPGNTDETKLWAAGVGPIQDAFLRLVSF